MVVGSKVVCVNDLFTDVVRALYPQLPVKGATYTVRAMFPGRGTVCVFGPDGAPIKNAGNERPELGILLHELVNPRDPLCDQRELGFNAERFADVEEVTATERVEEVAHA